MLLVQHEHFKAMFKAMCKAVHNYRQNPFYKFNMPGRRQLLVIWVFCKSGRHRSVALAETMHRHAKGSAKLTHLAAGLPSKEWEARGMCGGWGCESCMSGWSLADCQRQVELARKAGSNLNELDI